MKKIIQYLGILFIICGFIFLFIFSSLVTGSPKEDFSRDLFGFPIPHPPIWTSYIPYVGFLIGIIFEYFSLHGLVGSIISGTLFYIGSLLFKLGDIKRKTIVGGPLVVDNESYIKEMKDLITRSKQRPD